MKETPENNYYFGISALPDDTVTTMAYVPYQTDKTMYDDEAALCRGTLFINLNKPFCRGAIR
ncbi:MAG: spore coat associated protein CotJA [Clostridia bacterium]|nr:spore coat associated protein CotJA [Clostridia bacterium]